MTTHRPRDRLCLHGNPVKYPPVISPGGFLRLSAIRFSPPGFRRCPWFTF